MPWRKGTITSWSGGRKHVMTKRLFTLLLMVAVLSTPSLAGSIFGTTGLFNTPTADIVSVGMFGASVHVDDNRVTGAFNYGLMDFLEVGAAVRFRDGQATRFSPFVKGQIFAETAYDPGIAAGIEDGSAFVVLSKAFAPLTRAHVGVGTGRFNGLFGGVSYVLNPVVVSRPAGFQPPRIMLIAEYDGRNPNVGTRLSFAQGLDVNVMLQGISDLMIGAAWRTRF